MRQALSDQIGLMGREIKLLDLLRYLGELIAVIRTLFSTPYTQVFASSANRRCSTTNDRCLVSRILLDGTLPRSARS